MVRSVRKRRVSNHAGHRAAHPSRRRFAPPQDEAKCWRSQCQTATHHRPVFWSGSGAPVFSFLPHTRGSGAPSGASTNSRPRRQACAKLALRRRHPSSGMPRRPALHCGDFLPRVRASGRDAGCPDPAASAALLPHHVQPLKAAPRSWSGRRPLASRRWLARHIRRRRTSRLRANTLRRARISCSANRTPLADAPGRAR